MTEKNSIRKIVAGNIRKYRKQNGLTQEKLAELAEISNTYIANIECGKTWISDKTLEKISAALNTKPYLFFLEQFTEETNSESENNLQKELKKIDETKEKICNFVQDIFNKELKLLLIKNKKD